MQALHFAQSADRITGNDDYELLKELGDVANLHVSRWTGQFSCHWSHFLGPGEVFETNNSFLDIAVAYGLTKYILAKIDEEHDQFLARVKADEVEANSAWTRHYFMGLQKRPNPDTTARELTL